MSIQISLTDDETYSFLKEYNKSSIIQSRIARKIKLGLEKEGYTRDKDGSYFKHYKF